VHFKLIVILVLLWLSSTDIIAQYYEIPRIVDMQNEPSFNDNLVLTDETIYTSFANGKEKFFEDLDTIINFNGKEFKMQYSRKILTSYSENKKVEKCFNSENKLLYRKTSEHDVNGRILRREISYPARDKSYSQEKDDLVSRRLNSVPNYFITHFAYDNEGRLAAFENANNSNFISYGKGLVVEKFSSLYNDNLSTTEVMQIGDTLVYEITDPVRSKSIIDLIISEDSFHYFSFREDRNSGEIFLEAEHIYDKNFQLIKEAYSDQRGDYHYLYIYNIQGQKTAKIDNLTGKAVTWEYDDRGRLMKYHSDLEIVWYRYNDKGDRIWTLRTSADSPNRPKSISIMKYRYK